MIEMAKTHYASRERANESDIFKQGDKYVIYWSPNDGRYCYFFFSHEEFNKLKQWLELENK